MWLWEKGAGERWGWFASKPGTGGYREPHSLRGRGDTSGFRATTPAAQAARDSTPPCSCRAVPGRIFDLVACEGKNAAIFEQESTHR